MWTSNNDLMYFLIISKAWQGYDSKAYGVSNHNLKLQCKKFNRTRDIQIFPTQGWAGTAFCTRKRSETYYHPLLSNFLKISRSSNDEKHKGGQEEGDVVEVDEMVEVDEKW